MAAKVVLIGAGSYVFTASTLYDLICDYRLADLELWFVDPDVESAELMAGVARRMAASRGIDVATSCTADRRDALPAADYVTTSVAVEGPRRWQTDRTVAERHGVIDVRGELGGVGGLSYTLRQVALLLGICRDVEELCPRAVLLNVSNPLPRVMTAIAGYTTVQACGLCNAAFGGVGGFENLARLLQRPKEEFHVVSGGTNHLSWLLEITEVGTGKDLYPALREVIDRLPADAMPLSIRCLRQYDRFPLSGDGHIAEFFPYDSGVMKRGTSAFHGTAEQRQRRRENLARTAAGEMPWEPLLEHRSWERPAEIINATVTGKPCELAMLNLPNRGAMPELADEAVVEVPCVVRDGTITARKVGPLPDRLRELLVTTSTVNTMAARAAATADRAILHDCIDADPAIPDKDGAHAAIEELIIEHADLLPDWVE